jgi:hypothetical protein
MKSALQRDICILMLIVKLFTIVNIWKQSNCSLMDRESVVHIHENVVGVCVQWDIRLLKEGNSAICNNMDKVGGHYVK